MTRVGDSITKLITLHDTYSVNTNYRTQMTHFDLLQNHLPFVSLTKNTDSPQSSARPTARCHLQLRICSPNTLQIQQISSRLQPLENVCSSNLAAGPVCVISLVPARLIHRQQEHPTLSRWVTLLSESEESLQMTEEKGGDTTR